MPEEKTQAPQDEGQATQAPDSEGQAESSTSDTPIEGQVASEVPDKFQGKPESEIVKHYQELERHATRQAQELSEIKRSLESKITQPLSEEDLQIQQAEQFVKSKAEELIKPLKEEITMLRFGQEINQAKKVYPRANDFTIQAVLVENKGKITPTEAVKIAHERVENLRKSAIDEYISGLETNRSQSGEATGQTLNLDTSMPPKDINEASAQAAKRKFYKD